MARFWPNGDKLDDKNSNEKTQNLGKKVNQNCKSKIYLKNCFHRNTATHFVTMKFL